MTLVLRHDVDVTCRNSQVLNCIAGYEPVNKARLMALLSAGSGSTKSIASFVAYCVIIDRTTAIAVRFFIGSIHKYGLMFT